MSDIVARLRQVKSARQQGFYTIHEPDALANEAADVIEVREAQIAALQARLAEARAALAERSVNSGGMVRGQHDGY